MNRTGDRWWPRRTSNSPEQPETARRDAHTYCCRLPENGQGKKKNNANFVLISQQSRRTNLLSAEQRMLVKGKEGRLNFLQLVLLPSLILHKSLHLTHQVRLSLGG